MANGVGTALGLSIGTTNLGGCHLRQRHHPQAVLTLYPDRPRRDRHPRGWRIPRLQARRGDHRLRQPGRRPAWRRGAPTARCTAARYCSPTALRALAYAATGGAPLPDTSRSPTRRTGSRTRWTPSALPGRCPRMVATRRPVLLIPDAAATLPRHADQPGIPARYGRGLRFRRQRHQHHVDAGRRRLPALAPTVRHRDFSGDLTDQALLSVAIANMPTTGAFPTGTAAIGSLSRLRSACRVVKEQLSSSTAATLTDGLTGTRGEIRLTRDELDDAIRPSLGGDDRGVGGHLGAQRDS